MKIVTEKKGRTITVADDTDRGRKTNATWRDERTGEKEKKG